jgi:hypothetical protein
MHHDRKASNPIEVAVLMCEEGLDNYGQICYK